MYLDDFNEIWQFDEKTVHQLDFISDFLIGIKTYPSHLTERNILFAFSRNEGLIEEDSELHGLRIAQSLIVPDQEGLFARRSFAAGEFITNYWGLVLVSDKENDLEDHECWGNSDRILALQVQPLAGFGKFIFVVGSSSCIGSYANSSRGVPGSNPNCEFTETSFDEMQHHRNDPPFPTFDCFLNWIGACPMQLRATRDIGVDEEILVDYEYVIEIDD